jgi:hypothetical protein
MHLKMSFPTPPKATKRKRISLSPPPCSPQPSPVVSHSPSLPPLSATTIPTSSKRKRTAAEISQTIPDSEKKRSVPKQKQNDTAAAGKISKFLSTQITYGTSRRQRHWVLEQMIAALKNLNCDAKDDELQSYFTRVEHRLYRGIFGKPMNACYNMYRSNLYRKMAFEIIYALRANGVELMEKYEPELLAALPGPYLAKGTKAGDQYHRWKEQREQQKAYENFRCVLATSRPPFFAPAKIAATPKELDNNKLRRFIFV